MSESTARHSLPLIQPAQAQKHVTHNEALEQLDLRVQLTVEAFDASTPPTLRNDGQIWALGPVPSGEWAGQGDRLAAWTNGAWIFLSPRIGWRAARGTELRIWTGNDWHAPDLPMLQDLHGVGIQTSFDTTNRLAVASEATLLTHAGADHQLKINKNEATDTASLLFQTGWSGRAEMGTAGSDAWSIKVSADGVDWRDALRADPATGLITIPEGVSVSGTISLPEDSLDLTSDPAFTGQLPLTHGGTGATTAAGARMALGLGDAATAQVTASATDATSGRLMKVGDFGLGGLIPPFPGNDIGITDNSVVTGIYRADNIAGLPPTVTRGSVIHTRRATGGGETQLLVEEGFPQRLFTSGRTTGAWASWKTYNPTLGTVSESGGIPTGAIIQRGSNSNGTFVRFADGTQICTFLGAVDN